MVLLGLKKIGGWSGLKAAVPASSLHDVSMRRPARSMRAPHPMGIGAVGLVLGVGIVLGGGTWCTDFRLLQTAMAAKNVESARRAPLIAAAVWVLVPLLLVLPGLIAVGLPTPRTAIVVHNENGAIYHEITVVPPAVEAGQGLVPAKADAAGKPMMGADGHAVLDYEMATPNMLLQFLPMGLLGLGLTALLACLMGGVAASLTAFSTVFTCDIYQAFFAKGASDKRMLAAGRWAAVGGMLLAIGAACAAMRLNSMLDAMVLVFAVVNAPLFATLLLGALWKRATGHGAFAGLIAGAAGALLHHGLALPQGRAAGYSRRMDRGAAPSFERDGAGAGDGGIRVFREPDRDGGGERVHKGAARRGTQGAGALADGAAAGERNVVEAAGERWPRRSCWRRLR